MRMDLPVVVVEAAMDPVALKNLAQVVVLGWTLPVEVVEGKCQEVAAPEEMAEDQ